MSFAAKLTNACSELWWFVSHPVTRYVVVWLCVAVAIPFAIYDAWKSFDEAERPSGNNGHATIDFGGQWLMGRMLVEGHGQDLYNRHVQREVLRRHYPLADQSPKQDRSDVENLMWWMMGDERQLLKETFAATLAPLGGGDPLGVTADLAATRKVVTGVRLRRASRPSVGGPLYPPVNAFLSYPVAHLKPQPAYRVNQILNLVLVFVAAAAVRKLSQGQIWWPVAICGILGCPGFEGSLNLGQNATLTLTIVLWGWALMAQQRPWLGGLIWGLLAFKPVWALSFFFVLAISLRWRSLLAMAAAGAGLALVTLPFVGLHSWFNWLHVGKDATDLYKRDKNWIFLSRDLQGIPRRFLLYPNDVDGEPEKVDSAATELVAPLVIPLRSVALGLERSLGLAIKERRDHFFVAEMFGLALLALVVSVTTAVALWRFRQSRAATGPVAAFLLLGAWLSCFHFMYYDSMLVIPAVAALLAEPRRFLKPNVVGLRLGRWGWPFVRLTPELVGPRFLTYFAPRLPTRYPEPLVFRSGTLLLGVACNVTLCLLVWFYAIKPYCYTMQVSFWFAQPRETFCVLALWLWCGWLWLWEGRGGRQVA